MKVCCPSCGRACGLRESVCSCGFTFSVRSVANHYLQGLKAGVKKGTTLECPICKLSVPVNATLCANGHPMTVEAAMHSVVGEPKSRFLEFCTNASPRAKRFIQWTHLIVSGVILGWLVKVIEERYQSGWLIKAALSGLYVSLVILAVRMFVPQQVFRILLTRTSWRVKLSLVFHMLSLMILLHIFVSAWWTRAAVFATIVGVAVLSATLFSHLGTRFIAMVRNSFLGPGASRPYEPKSPQGRSVRLE